MPALRRRLPVISIPPWPIPEGPVPTIRAHCENGPRPCPWVTCHHHLGVEELPSGSVRLAYPGRPFGAGPESCALDVAARGGITLEEVGVATGTTRERARQVEVAAIAKLQALGIFIEASP